MESGALKLLGRWALVPPGYTQLTDTYQEQNGIYGFDRSLKFDVDRISAIQKQRAAFEDTTDGDRG